MLGNAPLQAILFGVYGSALRAFEGEVSDTPRLSSVVAAGQVAGLITLLVTCPTEHCKILLQHQRESAGSGSAATRAGGRRLYTGSIDCGRDILRRHGLRGLYKGMLACFVRDVGVCSCPHPPPAHTTHHTHAHKHTHTRARPLSPPSGVPGH